MRKLFRFRGYKLIAEADIGGLSGTGSNQKVSADATQFNISAVIQDVRGSGDSGSVRVSVSLWAGSKNQLLSTEVTLRSGQTPVLGNAQVSGNGKVIILTVKPELVTP